MPVSPFDSTVNLLQTFLDAQTRRTEIVAGNLANANTPGFRAKELDFKQHLRDAVEQWSLPKSEQNEFTIAPAEVVEQQADVVGLDGNTVDAGKEMSTLAEAGGQFNFGAKMLQSRLRLLRTAIREGR